MRWDNIGFDGPVINNTREFEVPDAMVPTNGIVALGYHVADVSNLLKTTVTIKVRAMCLRPYGRALH